MSASPWKSIDADTPRDKPVILFLPAASHDTGRDGRPFNVKHVRVVGWWDETQSHWVAGLHSDRAVVKVYPSLWADCPDEPEVP